MSQLQKGICFICDKPCYHRDTFHVDCSRRKYMECYEKELLQEEEMRRLMRGDMQSGVTAAQEPHEFQDSKFDSSLCNSNAPQTKPDTALVGNVVNGRERRTDELCSVHSANQDKTAGVLS